MRNEHPNFNERRIGYTHGPGCRQSENQDPMANNDLTGHTLGQYTVTARLGRGGMADVYKAYHPKLEVYRALKVIRPEFVTASDFRERFQKEAQSVASLRHPNIVQIHDFGEQDDAYYMVMEFVEGQDLKRIVKAEGKLRPIKRCLQLIDQVADALHYAHSRGLIHRDIKPENIMINEEGLPILMDFGIAKLLTANTQLTQTGMGIGTPAYMAPEQAKALPEIGPAADIYSLSVVLYEMLTGQVPFSADTPMAVMLKAINDPTPMPRQFSSDISESLQQVLLKGMAKDAENRYETARQFQRALREVMEEEPGAGEPAATAVMQSGELDQPKGGAADDAPQGGGVSDRTTRVRERDRRGSGRPALVVALVLLALVLVGGAGAGVYFLLEPGQPEERVADATGPAAEPGNEPAADAPEETDEPGDPTPGDRSAPPEGETDALADEADSMTTEGLAESGETGSETRLASADAEGDAPGGPADPGTEEERPESRETADGDRTAMADTASGTEEEQSGPDAASESDPGAREPRTEAVASAAGGSENEAVQSEAAQERAASDAPAKPSALDGGFIAFGDYVSEEIPERGRGVAYEFDAEAGQSVFFDHVDNQRSARRVEFRLMAPDGQSPVFESRGDHGPVTLGEDGTYTLVADPRDERVAGYEFIVWNVDPPEVDGGSIQLGRAAEGRTSVPGQTVAYRFRASAGQTIRFDLVETTEPTDFTLTAPDGSRVFRTRDDHGPRTLDQSGTYTLVADPQEDRVSEFEFVVMPAAAG